MESGDLEQTGERRNKRANKEVALGFNFEDVCTKLNYKERCAIKRLA